MAGRYAIPLPTDAESFQEFVRDLLEYLYRFKLSIYGRSGQSQDGIDIIGTIPDKSYWT